MSDIALTGDQALEIWKGTQGERNVMVRQQDYFDGKHEILERKQTYADGRPKTNIATPFVKKLGQYVGALTSQPFQVSMIEKPEEPAEREEADPLPTDAYNDLVESQCLNATDVEHTLNSIVLGKSIEVHEFIEEGSQIIIRQEDPTWWHIIKDSDLVPTMAIRRVNLEAGTIHDGVVLTEKLRLLTIYDHTNIRNFKIVKDEDDKDKTEPIGNPIPHAYGRLPIVVFKANQDEESLVTWTLTRLVDGYDVIYSAGHDSITGDVDAILLLAKTSIEWLKEKSDPENKNSITNMELARLLKVLTFDSSDERPSYLTKNIDNKREEDHLARTRNLIHEEMAVPDEQQITGVTGSTSGIALKLRFMPMNHKANAMINYFKKGVQERIDLINIIQEALKEPIIEGHQITIVFTLPTNRLEEWANIGKLTGIVSKQSQLTFLSDVKDPDKEMKLIEDEDERRGEPEEEALRQQAVQQMVVDQIVPVVRGLIDVVKDEAIESLAREVAGSATETT